MPELHEAAHDIEFEALYRRERPGLVRLAIVLSGDAAVAEELVQEAFVRAYRDWDRVSRLERPGAWVRRVLCNLATSRGRRLRTERRARSRVRRGEPVALDPDWSPEVAEFWEAVRSLPPRQARVAALRYGDDLRVDDIASILGVAPGTVRAQLHSARTKLAARLRLDVGAAVDRGNADATIHDQETAI